MMTNDRNRGAFGADKITSKHLKAIIDCSFDGIYITDGTGNTIMINAAYERITGLTEADVMGKNMKQIVEEGLISSSGSLLAIKENRVVTLQQKFRTGKMAMITSTPIYNEDGTLVMIETNVRDLTEIYNLREQVEEKKRAEEKLRQDLEFIRRRMNRANLIACDSATLHALVLADKVAKVDAAVVLLGETGVGKEEFAKYIYLNSDRKDKAFVKVNCGAIPENLIESELFGYEKGAFTGASKTGKAGLFELADQGTIFLDEIGELPLNMQVKLLRVLQEQEIERIGATKPVKIDVRIIAATNRNLDDMMKQGKFREDLYYRLMVFPIRIPPLRERRLDIEPLAQNFLKCFNKKNGCNKKLSDSSMFMLNEYQWPGNIRELKNMIERAVIITSGDEIEPAALPIADAEAHSRKNLWNRKPVKDLRKALNDMELDYIRQAYEKYGNVRDAAKSLGMTASTFVRRRQKLEDRE